MKNQHTPGPWKHDETWGLIKYGKTEICALHSGNEANAAACIEPLGGSTGTRNSIDFEFYSNERGEHGYVFGTYPSKAELDYIYAGYTFDFMHIYPASWANKYPAHLRAIPVNAKLKHTTK